MSVGPIRAMAVESRGCPRRGLDGDPAAHELTASVMRIRLFASKTRSCRPETRSRFEPCMIRKEGAWKICQRWHGQSTIVAVSSAKRSIRDRVGHGCRAGLRCLGGNPDEWNLQRSCGAEDVACIPCGISLVGPTLPNRTSIRLQSQCFGAGTWMWVPFLR